MISFYCSQNDSKKKSERNEHHNPKCLGFFLGWSFLTCRLNAEVFEFQWEIFRRFNKIHCERLETYFRLSQRTQITRFDPTRIDKMTPINKQTETKTSTASASAHDKR